MIISVCHTHCLKYIYGMAFGLAKRHIGPFDTVQMCSQAYTQPHTLHESVMASAAAFALVDLVAAAWNCACTQFAKTVHLPPAFFDGWVRCVSINSSGSVVSYTSLPLIPFPCIKYFVPLCNALQSMGQDCLIWSNTFYRGSDTRCPGL